MDLVIFVMMKSKRKRSREEEEKLCFSVGQLEVGWYQASFNSWPGLELLSCQARAGYMGMKPLITE